MPILVHITDLHLDHYPANLDSMIALVRDIPADFYLVGGDNGGFEGISRTVEALRNLRPNASIAWIMGNHDLWKRPYTYLWNEFRELSATYLELENLETDDCTIVGTYCHYDYSGGSTDFSHEQYDSFTNGHQIWNDRYIDRLGKTNLQIAMEVAERFRQRYAAAVSRGLPIVVLTHTLPFAPTDHYHRNFFSAYCSNQCIGDILCSYKVRPEVLFCGHTHAPSQWDEFGFPMINTGSDYNTVRITSWDLPTNVSRVDHSARNAY